MKWSLNKSKKKTKAKNTYPSLDNLEFKIKNQMLVIHHQELIDNLLLKQINANLDELIKRILEYLADEDDNADETMLLFDELARLRSVFAKYDQQLSKEAKLNYMKKIRFVAFELKKRLIGYKLERTVQKEKTR